MKYIITENQYRILIEQRVKGDEITPQKYVVHSSNPSNRESISKTGIQKSLGECYLIYADSNYGEDEECVPAVFATNSLKKKDLFDSTYDDDLWVIDTEIAKVKWFKDAHFDFGEYPHIVTFEDIPVEAVRLVYKGTGRDTLDSYHLGDDEVSITENQNERVINLLKKFGNEYTDSEGRIVKTEIDVKFIPDRNLYLIYPTFYVLTKKGFPHNLYKHILAQKLEEFFGVSVHTSQPQVIEV